MPIPGKTPITYDGVVDIRFADLDHYNHVNSKHYVDLVSTVRLNFLADELKTSVDSITERGIGFFMTKSTINYKRPIVGLQKVRATSFVESVRDGKFFVIPFELRSEDGSTTFADGSLEFAIIDMKTKRSTEAPAWVLELFFK